MTDAKATEGTEGATIEGTVEATVEGPTTIISIDVGIINFAYCVMRRETKEILRWECFALCNGTEMENCKDLIQKLEDRQLLTADTKFVLVERQPKCNPKMRILSETVRTYFLIRSVDLKFPNVQVLNWSPKYKLQCYTGTDTPDFTHLKSTYSQRKKIGIFHCERLLQETNQKDTLKRLFQESKKKDDLADCFLQLLSFVLYRGRGRGKKARKDKSK